MTDGAGIPPVRITGLRRTFSAVVALDDAQLEVRAGEVHALVGENGAGKTTLLSILAGHLTPDAGSVQIEGVDLPNGRGAWTPRAAWNRGVGMVHQHFALVPRLTGRENLALGVRRNRKGWALPTAWLQERVASIRAETGLEVELDRPVEQLSIGERQRLEILKVLLRDPRILVLDEPTAVLAPSEVTGLLALLRRLAAEGRAVLLVAHKLDEVLAVADRITVLREGRTVLEAPRSAVTARSVAEAMVGDASALAPPDRAGRANTPPDAQVRARWRGREDGVDLELRAGEIVGIAGVEGNGQRALARRLAGREGAQGHLDLPDRIAYIPQDRGHEGLIPSFSLVENIALGQHSDPELNRGPLLRWDRIADRTQALVGQYGVRSSGIHSTAGSLSGGNQQRLLVARELDGDPGLVIAENPTRGLDVAGARFVHDALHTLRGSANPPATVLISTDLAEVLALSDRIFTLVRGRLVAVPREEMTREGVGARMLEAGPEAPGDGMAGSAEGSAPGDGMADSAGATP